MTKVAIITGGGTGIGLAAGRKLAEAGWRVVLAGRRTEVLERATSAHPALVPMAADVTNETAVEHLFAETVARFGRVDLLFNNAGTFSRAAPLPEVELADFSAALAVNVTGMFLCARAAFRAMAAQSPQGGRIINNGSISAHAPRPQAVAYTVSKHAITGLTRALSLEGRAYDIACGQIDIGNAATELTAGIARGSMQADGHIAPEPMMDVEYAAASVLHMASLPLSANVQFMTVMATAMPYIGRG
ncbi:MAG: SDR family NAD(P)-dependent oxidoreductase [Acidocella sp.]|nr:SDR family NAD(P)-dependent oxidoreductase [Acidocella sp.]MDR3717639.1 SDR family NAD(P)-dependent oxidoreductase [Bryobacteraceae bacterium]